MALKLVVGVSDMAVSADPEDLIATYSLGSCIGVSIYDPERQVGGILHFQLPSSGENGDKDLKNPYMYADTGIPELFRAAYRLGAEKRRLVVRVAGGSRIMDKTGFFNIGERNYVTMRKMFWKSGVMIKAEDVGGDSWRTMFLDVGSGVLKIKDSRAEYSL